MTKKFKPDEDFQINIPTNEAVTFDSAAFDALTKSQGVMLEHWYAQKCPVGTIDRFDSLRRPHDHEGFSCSNGMVYTAAGTFQGTFTGNGLNNKSDSTGNLDSSTAQVIVPRFYTEEDGANGHRIHPAPYDRFYYVDQNILVSNWELIEAHISGRDRLSFPAVDIVALIDARGVRYSEGEDFSLAEGVIVWSGQRQPGQDVDAVKGRVFSVRYHYRPFWYVSRMLHEIRVVSMNDPATGERVTEPVNKLVSLQREYVFLNEEADSTTVRRQAAPADGSFGPK